MISPLGYTGLAYYDYSLSETLSRLGVDVQLYTSDNWLLSSYPASFSLIKAYKNCSGKQSKLRKGINYVRSSMSIVLEVLRSHRNIVHFQIVELPAVDLIVMLCFKLTGKHIVFTPHDIDHNKDFLLNTFILRLMYRLSNRVIVHKEVNADVLGNVYRVCRRKIMVTRHGGYEYFLDGKLEKKEARKHLNLPDEDRVVLFFGTIKRGKGLEVLLPAVRYLHDRISTIYLLIAGKPVGEMTAEKLMADIEMHGVGKITHLICGFIPDSEVEYYYKAADIVVLPYTNLSESGVAKYAQSCGCTVVCSDKKEFRDTVQDGVTGAFFNSGDPADLAKVMEKVLTTYDLDKIGQAAREIIEKSYGWKEIGLETRQLYSSLSA